MAHVPVVSIYNPVSMTILTAAGKHITIHDAATGKVCNEFFNITKDEITAVCLDDRKRKFIVGTTGGDICVHNYLNGAPMKKAVAGAKEALAFAAASAVHVSLRTAGRSLGTSDAQLCCAL